MGTVETPHDRGGTAHDEGVGPAPSGPTAPRTTTPSRREEIPLDAAQEDALRARLETDPNDEPAFRELADLVRRGAAEGHEGGDPQKAADDSVWSLAEEMARSPRAWYPLVELARLSLPEDRDGALRRLAIASDRDHSGKALAEGLNVLRDAGLPDEALGLGVGHWRPRDHDPDAGRHLVHAAVEAGRIGEARRHLAAFEQFPDQARVIDVRTELERTIEAAAAARSRPTA